MNERYKTLWFEAAELESDPSWEGQTKFMAKFAELIVKECADFVDRAISDGGVDGRILKEHFGVEE
jgi:hypothetical protein